MGIYGVGYLLIRSGGLKLGCPKNVALCTGRYSSCYMNRYSSSRMKILQEGISHE
jgi:hypothetical protein